jgi:hypothetical protein
VGSEVQDREFANHVARRQAAGDWAAERLPADAPACVRPNDETHRASDWRLADGGQWVCGVCHPPAPALDIERRTETNREETR